jgi:RNA polymerase sigma factor (sigma-70 family)
MRLPVQMPIGVQRRINTHDLPGLPVLSRLRLSNLHLCEAKLVPLHPIGVGGEGPPTQLPMPEGPLDQLIAQRKRFLAFVQRRVLDHELAEDILQSAYLRALEHRDDFKPSESAGAWFYRLLRNAVIDNHRRHTSKEKALAAWRRQLETSTRPSPELQNEVCACLRDIVEGLKPEYSEVLRAVDIGEQRVQDFAGRHRLSVSNAGVRVHRARAALRKQLLRMCATCAEHGCMNCTCKKDRHACAE